MLGFEKDIANTGAVQGGAGQASVPSEGEPGEGGKSQRNRKDQATSCLQ